MKTCYLLFAILFTLLTFLGSAYVLMHHGTMNAGYACIPMVLALAFLTLYRKAK